ncbi:sodium:solute symporter [marine bacterium AO1-C]|nr:sodium:solute symporter [marine bacterium AO1-C]
MHIVDILIFIVYLLGMLGIGWYFMRQNQSKEDYYVGGRNIGSWHIGLSVVATDVGGGFSIGLGGLGFAMGLAGSWLLFTGLLGAWLAAVFLIPKIKKLEETQTFYTFPQIFQYFYNPKVALLAGIISGIGYLGFTSSQILAGAKLASATVKELDMTTALIIMGAVVIVYTVMGGIKAVIYSDTIQWIILMVGLIFVGIPISIYKLGGWAKIQASLAASFFDITNISAVQLINWGVSIIPIWFVGMTLYQRIYASAGEKQAKKAWFIAGLFEYPVMAFMGVMLGLLARVAADDGLFAYMGYETVANLDKEMGLPLLLRTVLPVGFLGIMLSAYFSAIMSTADSCLMAASGNIVTDILGRFFQFSDQRMLRVSQIATLAIGAMALLLATFIQNVLSLMLYSYAFMVSGLFVPLLGALYWRKSHPTAAIWAMLLGGMTTVILSVLTSSKQLSLPWGLDANIFGITVSLLAFVSISQILFKEKSTL